MSKQKLAKRKGRLDRGSAIATVLMLYDLLAIHLSYFLALWLRFDLNYSTIPRKYLYCYTKTITIYALICVAIYWVCRMYIHNSSCKFVYN